MVVERQFSFDTQTLQAISTEQAWHYSVIPVEANVSSITFLVSAGSDTGQLGNELELILGKQVRFIEVADNLLKESIQKFYRKQHQPRTSLKPQLVGEDEDFLNRLIREAKDLGSSDIHLEPHEKKGRVRIRIDGKLLERYLVNKTDYPGLINKIKIKASLDISEKRLPQDGRIFFESAQEKMDIRVSIIPTMYGEKVVLRLLNSSAVKLNLGNLGFHPEELYSYREAIRKPSGIILISGPTGSGKTTTLYATLNELNKMDVNIISIEDPIEYTLEGINQVQLRENIGLDFASALRTFLRQDPDIIMVGEIRDKETANMAIRAALTGHLVLSTIHTNSAWGSVSRLVDMGIPSYLLATTLNATLAQRLLRLLCDHCKEKKEFRNDVLPRGYKPIENIDSYFVPKGCDQCYHTGYKGRNAIYEVIGIDYDLQEFIKSGELKVDSFLKTRNVHSLADNAFSLFKRGLTSAEEVIPFFTFLMIMKSYLLSIIMVALLFFLQKDVSAQDRFVQIDSVLTYLADSNRVPGLTGKITISVSEVTLQEFLRGIAQANQVNLNIDPALNFQVSNNIFNESLKNVLLHLCMEYDLDITHVGTIISIFKYKPPKEDTKPIRQFSVKYDALSNALTYDLKSDTLSSVVKKIIQISNYNIILAPGIGGKFVSGYVQNMPLEAALDNLAFSNQLVLSHKDEHTFVFEDLARENSAVSQKKGTEQQFTDLTRKEGVKLVVNKDINGYDLINLEAYNISIAELIKLVSDELKTNYFMFSEPQGKTTMQIEGLRYNQFLSYVLQGSSHTYKDDQGIYLIGERNQEGLRESRMIKLQYRSVDQVLDNIPLELKRGVEAKVFAELNSVILSGSSPNITEIEYFMRNLDQVVPVILIEVYIVDFNKNKRITTGVEAGLSSTPVETKGTFLPGLNLTLSSGSVNKVIETINGWGIINLGNVAPEFYITLKALEEQGVARIGSTPKLATLNAHEATLKIGTTDYYFEQTQSIIGSQNPQTVVSGQYKPINADFSVTINPTVSGDDHITLQINVSQSRFIQKSAPDAPPGSANREFESLIRVKNGDMIVLGGLEESEKSDTGSGLPLLSRVPVLKWFFSNRSKVTKKSQLNIFIKPTIIY